MLIQALVSPATRAAILADDWLATLEWCFEAGTVPADLLIIEPLFAAFPEALPPGTPVWMYRETPERWDAVPCGDSFVLPLDPVALAVRLLAMLWCRGELLPVCLSGVPLRLENGIVSLVTGHSRLPAAAAFIDWQVVPLGKFGGDMALQVDFPGRTLLVLADAIGHGEKAALNAVVFGVLLVQCFLPQPFGVTALHSLDQWVTRCIEPGGFVAAAFLDVNWHSCQVQTFNAGMPDILLARPEYGLERFPSQAPPFGFGQAGTAAPRASHALQPRSYWILSSDGIDDSALRRHVAADGFFSRTAESRGEGGIPLVRSIQADDDASHIIFATTNAFDFDI